MNAIIYPMIYIHEYIGLRQRLLEFYLINISHVSLKSVKYDLDPILASKILTHSIT